MEEVGQPEQRASGRGSCPSPSQPHPLWGTKQRTVTDDMEGVSSRYHPAISSSSHTQSKLGDTNSLKCVFSLIFLIFGMFYLSLLVNLILATLLPTHLSFYTFSSTVLLTPCHLVQTHSLLIRVLSASPSPDFCSGVLIGKLPVTVFSSGWLGIRLAKGKSGVRCVKVAKTIFSYNNKILCLGLLGSA